MTLCGAGYKLHVHDVPRRPDAKQLRHQSRVHDVPTAFGDNLAENRHTQKREIADDVQNLVTYELISKTKTRLIQHSFRRQHDRIVERTAANQVCTSQRFDLVRKPKRPRRGDVTTESAVTEFHKQTLHANHRMREVDQAVDLIRIR